MLINTADHFRIDSSPTYYHTTYYLSSMFDINMSSTCKAFYFPTFTFSIPSRFFNTHTAKGLFTGGLFPMFGLLCPILFLPFFLFKSFCNLVKPAFILNGGSRLSTLLFNSFMIVVTTSNMISWTPSSLSRVSFSAVKFN